MPSSIRRLVLEQALTSERQTVVLPRAFYDALMDELLAVERWEIQDGSMRVYYGPQHYVDVRWHE